MSPDDAVVEIVIHGLVAFDAAPDQTGWTCEEVSEGVFRMQPPRANQENVMHYRNGREAKNGDKLVQIGEGGKIVGVGILYDAVPGNDYCNGLVAPTVSAGPSGACLVDCLHADDLAALLAEKGLHKRPAGK